MLVHIKVDFQAFMDNYFLQSEIEILPLSWKTFCIVEEDGQKPFVLVFKSNHALRGYGQVSYLE